MKFITTIILSLILNISLYAQVDAFEVAPKTIDTLRKDSLNAPTLDSTINQSNQPLYW